MQRASLEGLFWLVIIAASIIAQVVKASKRMVPPGEPATDDRISRDAMDGVSPDMELRDFLRRLGVTQTVEHPSPPPPPPPPATSRRQAPTTRRADRPAPTPAPVRAATPARPRQKAAAVPATGKAIPGPQTPSPSLRRLLAHPMGLRQGILLREILGPPVALRR